MPSIVGDGLSMGLWVGTNEQSDRGCGRDKVPTTPSEEMNRVRLQLRNCSCCDNLDPIGLSGVRFGHGSIGTRDSIEGPNRILSTGTIGSRTT